MKKNRQWYFLIAGIILALIILNSFIRNNAAVVQSPFKLTHIIKDKPHVPPNPIPLPNYRQSLNHPSK